MARNRSRSVKRGPKNQVWTTILNQSVTIIAGATKTGTNIVQDDDWSGANGQERATILRVRGWFSLVNKFATGSFAGGGFFAYVGLYDNDELSAPANLAGTYAAEDIMATWGKEFAFTDTGTVGDVWSEVIDIKAMRKIRTGQALRFVATNSTANDAKISLVIRALVRKGGN